MQKIRIDGLDIFRGLALLLMIMYHFTYDLNHFHLITIDMNHTPLFLVFRYTIMSMFLFSVGISLALVHTPKIRWKSIQKRILLLGGASLIVTIATYIEFPHAWVYFGILHFILLASLVGLLFLPYPKMALVTAVVILIGSATETLNMQIFFQFIQPILHLPIYTEDLVPFIPWFAVVLLGIGTTHYKLPQKLFTLPLVSNKYLFTRGLKFIGQHSLLIYLIHQPILFSGFMLVSKQ